MNPNDYNQTALDDSLSTEHFPERMTVWKEVLLWIAFLPAAGLGSTVVFWIANLFVWLGSSYYGDDTWFYHLWREVITNGACGYAFAYCGAYVAPRGKIAVAITLAGLVILISGISVLVSIRDHRWMELLGVASIIGGVVICAVQVAKGEQTF